MLRSALTLLLLLHYLLVACAGVAGRPEAAAAARPFAYVHSPDCQLRNAWRGGICFEDCHGTQYQRGTKPPTLPQVLAALKGVDVHCLPAPAAVAGAAPVRYQAERRSPGREGRVPAGVRGDLWQPPRRG